MKKILRKRSTWLAVTTAAVVTAITFGTVTFAQAADSRINVYVNGTMRGSITHIDSGDRFKICDQKKDGHGVVGYVQLKGGGDYEQKYNGNGAGTCVYFTHNILTGKWYEMSIGVVDGPYDATGPKNTKFITE